MGDGIPSPILFFGGGAQAKACGYIAFEEIR